jgi:thiosulfate reductase cytochrome b subunit
MRRRWHFFFAWLLVANLTVYLVAGIVSGHLRRDLLPSRQQLRRSLLNDAIDHLRLNFPHGEEACHYNPVQKLTYLGVIGVLLPLMILTGLTMSPGMQFCPGSLTYSADGNPRGGSISLQPA